VGCGYFALTASYLRFILFPLALALLGSSEVRAEHPGDEEAALLHRSFDLASVRQWNRDTGAWQSIDVPSAKVYVVNLWAIHCQPCLAEFPQLRNVAAGWKSNSEVQFVFLADPPSETTAEDVVAFWQKNKGALPDAHPCRSVGDNLRRALGSDKEPITLLLDENFIVRQAFIGAIADRPLGRAIERLLLAAKAAGMKRSRVTKAK
jgi:thiol-disulfide isomerase/thioredoxin